MSSAASALECSAPKAYVVLLHGIFGWTTTEVGGVPHFLHAHILEETGCFIVLTPAMAILGSNFDRAVQVHAQLVGGFADHGKAHSSNVSTQHLRYGSTNYPAMIPDLLEPGGLPVYFVAHSLVSWIFFSVQAGQNRGSCATRFVCVHGRCMGFDQHRESIVDINPHIYIYVPTDEV